RRGPRGLAVAAGRHNRRKKSKELTMSKMTIDDLSRLLAEEAGAIEAGALTSDVIDTGFEALGYDSLALLGIAARIAKEFGVEIPDDVLFDLKTPRSVLDLVNGTVRELR